MKLTATLLLLLSMGLSAAAQADARNACVQDLEFLPDFLLTNDTGANDHLAQKGQAHFDAAFAKALAQANQVTDVKQCRKIIQDYLRSWRSGHLEVVVTAPAKKVEPAAETAEAANEPQPPKVDTRAPSIRMLSDQTLLLTVPSFGAAYTKPLAALLQKHHAQLANHPNWIIDVRNNGGGSDSTYAQLLPWFMADGWLEIGMEWLVTPTTIDAQASVCALFMPGDSACTDNIDPVLAVMRTAETGSYIALEEQAATFKTVESPEPKRPSKVAVLTNKHCASSCEQFLLTAQQSFSVKVVGQRSYGALDYSNLRPYALPSQQLTLYYATSRSRRLPDMPVDVLGVIPDVYLAPAQDEQAEVERVQTWLEGGRL